MRRIGIVVGALGAVAAGCAGSGAAGPVAGPAVATATVTASSTTAGASSSEEDEAYGPQQFARDARALAPLYTTPLARAFLSEAQSMPSIAPRTVWHSADKARWYRAAEAPDEASLVAVTIDETDFYAGRWGSPLAYTRAIDVLGAAGGVTSLAGKKVLDIGCGGVASLRLIAALGATVVGYDVDASLPVVYGEPGDQGEVVGAQGTRGSTRLSIAPTPFVPRPPEAPFDVIVSKNTLKRGYVHPDREVDPRKLIALGVDDVTYLAGLHDLLAPGGLMLVYNIGPPQAPPDQPYIPWADTRSPWTPGEWEAAGFDVLAFDVVDDGPMRAMARGLRWGDVDTSYFAHYTLVRRR